jgi:internalin A
LTTSLKQIIALPALEELFLYQSRLSDAPAEVLSQSDSDNCHDTLRPHYEDLAAGSVAASDVKLMILGNGRVGKTQICRRLRGEDYDETVSSTHGTIVMSAGHPTRKGEDELRLNIWDFGGQDIYHSTHALFMRGNAIFMLVSAPVTENQQTHKHGGVVFRNYPLACWVDYVRHLRGEDICALIPDACDQPEDKVVYPVPEIILRHDFDTHYPLTYSAANNRGRCGLGRICHLAA